MDCLAAAATTAALTPPRFCLRCRHAVANLPLPPLPSFLSSLLSLPLLPPLHCRTLLPQPPRCCRRSAAAVPGWSVILVVSWSVDWSVGWSVGLVGWLVLSSLH